MKKLLVVLIIPLLIGCFTTYRPISGMYDWQITSEYKILQNKLARQEAKYLIYPRYVPVPERELTGYTTTGYINTYGSQGSYYSTTRPNYSYTARNIAKARNLGERIKASVLKSDIDKMRARISVLNSEMSRRGLMP